MKTLIIIVGFLISALITWSIGLDQTASRPNLNFGNSQECFYRNMEIELLKRPGKKYEFSDVLLFSDSIMISKGFSKYQGFYYFNGKKSSLMKYNHIQLL